jgi:hypothetical protein
VAAYQCPLLCWWQWRCSWCLCEVPAQGRGLCPSKILRPQQGTTLRAAPSLQGCRNFRAAVLSFFCVILNMECNLNLKIGEVPLLISALMRYPLVVEQLHCTHTCANRRMRLWLEGVPVSVRSEVLTTHASSGHNSQYSVSHARSFMCSQLLIRARLTVHVFAQPDTPHSAIQEQACTQKQLFRSSFRLRLLRRYACGTLYHMTRMTRSAQTTRSGLAG